MSHDMCEISCVHEDKVNRVKENLPLQHINQVTSIFKALSDPTRMKIAYALSIEKELCVCDAASIADSSTATASHHLRLLRQLGLAHFRKEGKMVYYSLADENVRHLVLLAFQQNREVNDLV